MPAKPQRLYYTVKLSSDLLKEYNYDLTASFNECLEAGLIISLSDSQMLKSIRDITGKKVDLDLLEEWYSERDRLKKSKNVTKEKKSRIKELQKNIYDMMYIPEYITVVMDNVNDYKKMFKTGFKFNGRTYRRISCSASQARVSTIAFVDETIKDELRNRLNCGRDMGKALAPSKVNAYFGLYSSATKQVTEPRFCVVKDYCENMDVDVDFSVETGRDDDDIIEQRTLDLEFNRFDGSGLISPQMAEVWSKDIGEDYVPCQFCVRYAFTKGLVNEFDFVEWCRDENDGNYIIKDIYGNDVDLREIDVILTEGQVKLWDSWKSQEDLVDNAHKNGIIWGVTKYSPKEDKEAATMNYQYLQTLDLQGDSIQKICEDTVKYIKGVSYDDVYYTLLFCMGQNMQACDIEDFLQNSDNYWLKSMVLDHNILNDKYSREKIRDMVVTKIEQACLGRLIVNGNYQAIVPDSYSFMQAMCGHKVTGLLKDGEFYSKFWADKCEDRFACARSPMTHISEWYVARNKYKAEDESEEDDIRKIEKYFRYSYSGIITNTHGIYTMNFSGSDFDFDILFTSNNKEIINNKYEGQRVVTYKAPKPQKRPNLTEHDLFVSDTFSFGQQIGPLTNIATTICALIPTFEVGSRERQLLEDRLKMCCVNQSKQIDKTKIGQDVKCIPKIWKVFQKVSDGDSEEVKKEKEFYNSILADKKPYFFRYKYHALNKEYNEYIKKTEENAMIRFGKTLDSLLESRKDEAEYDKLTEDEKIFLMYYDKFLPVVDSDCVMNNICKYIEGIDFSIKKKIKNRGDFDYRVLQSGDFEFNKEMYEAIKGEVARTLKIWEALVKASHSSRIEKSMSSGSGAEQNGFKRDVECELLKDRLLDICGNEEELSNYLIYLFYEDKPSYNKSTLWNMVGKQLYQNIRGKKEVCYFPVKDENGDIEFLYEKYAVKKIALSNDCQGQTKNNNENNEQEDDSDD